MSKIGEPFLETYEDSGFDEFLSRPFEGLGEAGREFQEQTGYSYDDLVANMESLQSKQFTTTIAFSSTDYRTVAWAEGVIEYQDSTTTPTIAASNTGNMAARTYIYYDPQASKVALQTTTTASIATQGERILLAIAVPDADTNKKAEVQTFGATGMYVGSLTVNQLVSGTIRSKTVTLAVTAGAGDSYFNAGKTDFTNTDSGFILGIDDSDSDKAKFYIGDSSKYLNWDGSDVILQGLVKDGSGTTLIDATGLVSTVSFNTGQAGLIDGTIHSTTSTSVVDIPNTTITAFEISRTAGVVILFVGNFVVVDPAKSHGRAWIFVGGDINDIQEDRIVIPASETGSAVTRMTYNLRQITAATPPTSYTIKARWQCAVSGQTLRVVNRQISYMLFGV